MVCGMLDGFFEDYLGRDGIFTKKKVLQAGYSPSEILHREAEVKQIANILVPVLKGEKASNVFVYGKTGTGKTLTAKFVLDELNSTAEKKNINLKVVYLNCKLKRAADTEYRLIAQLLREFGISVPVTGLPTEELYRLFYGTLTGFGGVTLLVLDEIDYLVKKAGDGFLYNLTRLPENTEAQVSLVGVSNDVTFPTQLDPRVKSSLSEEEVIFPPYNALQIQDILRARADIAFGEGVLEQGVVEKCAAYAAREHGDARRALELLRVAGEVAEREESKSVALCHIDQAEKKIDRDTLYDLVATQPKQYHFVLNSILNLCEGGKKTFTGDVYTLYRNRCTNSNVRTLTQRRISDIIAEFDMLGVVNATLISKGRYGRTKEISVGMSEETLGNVRDFLKKELNW